MTDALTGADVDVDEDDRKLKEAVRSSSWSLRIDNLPVSDAFIVSINTALHMHK